MSFLTIIEDPDRRYGFRPGTTFGFQEARQMLRQGAFTPGTVVEVRGERYRVRAGRVVWRKETYRQLLVAAGGWYLVTSKGGVSEMPLRKETVTG